MLGRKGCKWSYIETVVMENDVQAEMAYDFLINELEKHKDYEEGHVELSIETIGDGIPALQLREDKDSSHVIRFITDGERIGLNIRSKRPKQSQVYVPLDESL